ncbi:MAG: GIY-YIG nuclease family protein [Sulfurimonas sp.]|uniref:GIY-YIG nuclease family protein n=1 Tax=Sulfurimonas sp. TaxID=2022749 RepID=UPI003D0E98EB
MVYFIKNIDTGRIKIGFSDTPTKRLKELQTGNDNKLVLIKTIAGDKNKEASLHEMFSHLRSNGEWFDPDDELLQFIKETNTKSLDGKFFHTFKNNQVEWQGYIISEPKDGFFLIQLFDWILGEPSNQKLVSINDMLSWNFYDSVEEMNDAYYNKYK